MWRFNLYSFAFKGFNFKPSYLEMQAFASASKNHSALEQIVK
jgi:hypothetical protein